MLSSRAVPSSVRPVFPPSRQRAFASGSRRMERNRKRSLIKQPDVPMSVWPWKESSSERSEKSFGGGSIGRHVRALTFRSGHQFQLPATSSHHVQSLVSHVLQDSMPSTQDQRTDKNCHPMDSDPQTPRTVNSRGATYRRLACSWSSAAASTGRQS